MTVEAINNIITIQFCSETGQFDPEFVASHIVKGSSMGTIQWEWFMLKAISSRLLI